VSREQKGSGTFCRNGPPGAQHKRFLTPFSLLAALALAAAAALPAFAGDGLDPRIQEMFERALRDEPPTPEDQRTAERALRDWRLSERTDPSGDRRTEALLRALAEGQRLPPELLDKAGELQRDYLTPEGRRRRAREAAALAGRQGAGGDSPEGPPERAGGWFLLGVAALVLIGGVAIAVVSGRRGRPDQRAW